MYNTLKQGVERGGLELKWLKHIRIDADMTQIEVAEKVGITQQMYWMIENGERRPSVETAKKIAAVLGFDWTMFYPDEQKGA